jgi:hypothetical protein
MPTSVIKTADIILIIKFLKEIFPAINYSPLLITGDRFSLLKDEQKT